MLKQILDKKAKISPARMNFLLFESEMSMTTE